MPKAIHSWILIPAAALLTACASVPAPQGLIDPARAVVLPDDIAEREEFPNEWWYYAGRLQADDGTDFAFHLSFFRHWSTDERRFGFPVRWVDNPGRFAHGALTNLATGRRDTREVWGVRRKGSAGARADRFEVWTADWRAEAGGDDVHLVRAELKQSMLRLRFEPTKPLVVHGGDGTGAPPSVGGSASHYISSTRMAVSGAIRLCDGRELAVRGDGWFDNEMMGPDVARGHRGWDWFAQQLNDGSELVIYRFRREDGSPSGQSMAAWIDSDGNRQPLADGEFTLDAVEHWQSPRSGARYPVRWAIAIPRRGIELQLEAVRRDSELRGRFSQITYWEGLARVKGQRRGRPLGGHGFVELTGYAKSIRKL